MRELGRGKPGSLSWVEQSGVWRRNSGAEKIDQQGQGRFGKSGRVSKKGGAGERVEVGSFGPHWREPTRGGGGGENQMSKVVRFRIKGKRNLARGRKWRKSGHRCFGKKTWYRSVEGRSRRDVHA